MTEKTIYNWLSRLDRLEKYAVKDFAADTAIELICFPRRSPQLNPSEKCWRQFKQFLGNRSFDDFAELRDAMHPAFDAISPPNIRNYLLP